MIKQAVILILLILFSCLVQISYGDEEASVVNEWTGTEAVLLHSEVPVYPQRALRQGLEGWVIIGFVVSPEGMPEDINILEVSTGGYFEEATIQAVELRRYTPAMLNGVPVAQAKNTVRITFVIDSAKGAVSGTFHSQYKKANRYLEKEDLESVKRIIDTLDSLQQRLLAEVCFLDILKGNYWKKMGDLPLAFHHYERALVIAKLSVPAETYISLLEQGVLFGLSQTDYSSALENYDLLLEEYPDYPPDGPISKHVMAARQFIDSDTLYPTEGEIVEPCPTCEILVPNWYHDLLRDRFTVQNVTGEISELKLLCGFQYVSIEYSPDTTWSLNREWGDCALQVLGAEGTTFTLVEL